MIHTVCYFVAISHRYYPFLIKSKGFFLDVMQLLKDNDGCNDQDNADGKLRNDQYFSEGYTASTHFEKTFQCFYRLE